MARLKKILGGLLNLSTAGDDAWITYGRALSVILHAARAGDGLDQVPFMINSPKDYALARILEEALLAVGEDARDLSLPEWAKHCAELLANKSLSDRSRAALTLGMNDFFRHETWTSYFPPAGSGPGGVDLPGTKFMRAHASAALLQMVWSEEFAFANGSSLAAVSRLFGYTGGLIRGMSAFHPAAGSGPRGDWNGACQPPLDAGPDIQCSMHRRQGASLMASAGVTHCQCGSLPVRLEVHWWSPAPSLQR